MALIAIHAAVDIPTHIAMAPIGVGLGMAIGALKDTVVPRIGMAGGTDSIRASVVHREPGVIEGRAQPGRSRVTRGARRGKSSRHVIWTVGRLVLVLVTAVTIRRYGGVIVVDVTIRTRNRSMRARQREAGVVVIKGGRAPGGRVVAHVTLLREADRNMVRVLCVLKICQVAADACRIADVVVPIDVALAALHARMCTGQRPTSGRVIED
jgi:hypothetical protein